MRLKTINETINLERFSIVPASEMWFRVHGDEIYTRDIWPDTRDIPMVIRGTSGFKKRETTVPVHKLVPSQPTVTKSLVIKYAEHPGDKLPIVFLIDGYFHIQAGHHRLAAETLKGEEQVKAIVYK